MTKTTHVLQALAAMDAIQIHADKIRKRGRITTALHDAYILDFYAQHEETVRELLVAQVRRDIGATARIIKFIRGGK